MNDVEREMLSEQIKKTGEKVKRDFLFAKLLIQSLGFHNKDGTLKDELK
jgi:hypothetical protein